MENDFLIKQEPLLSICIPTYNRAEYLREALENITNDPAFGIDIEVIISDNASTDHTKDIAEFFSKRFPNIHYYRNSINVKDKNYILCLKRATGKYRKLSNDTLRYKPGAIAKIVETLRINSEYTPIVFFQNLKFSKKNTEVSVSDIAELIKTISYFIGWIASFGLWETDMDCLEVDEKYTKLQFVQVAWILEILKKHNKLKLIFGDLYFSHEPLKKAKYNFFKVHISNLSRILEDYHLKGKEYEVFKYRLFRYLILPRIYNNVYCKETTGFDLSNMWETLLMEYRYRVYIYPALLITKLKSIIKLNLTKSK